MKTPHKHAALMAEYAKDAAIDRDAFRFWQYQLDGSWFDCQNTPSWSEKRNYRRKPKTININGHEVPEPLKTAPNLAEPYWFPALGAKASVYESFWDNRTNDKFLLSLGLVHLNKESATAHAQALLSFTKLEGGAE